MINYMEPKKDINSILQVTQIRGFSYVSKQILNQNYTNLNIFYKSNHVNETFLIKAKRFRNLPYSDIIIVSNLIQIKRTSILLKENYGL